VRGKRRRRLGRCRRQSGEGRGRGRSGTTAPLASGEVRQRHMWELAQSASEGVRCERGPDASMGRAGEEHGRRHGLDLRVSTS
jgi:hypothetical protein